jgi:CopG family nickel-responsive transcriptional regulator
MAEASKKSRLARFSVSVPADVVRAFDQMAKARGFANRSQCLTALVNEAVVDHASEREEAVMMGLITFIYDHRRRNLQNRITDIQHRYLKEIITIQLVHLEKNRSLQILLVQGPARVLRQITDRFATLKGVHYGKLQLSTDLLPPLHEGKA